jgi:hypothetical protein
MKNIDIIKTESMYGLIFITAKVLNDDKVAEIRVQCKEDNKQVQNILVKFHSGKSSTYSGNLSNHKMPPKYKKYVAEIMGN